MNWIMGYVCGAANTLMLVIVIRNGWNVLQAIGALLLAIFLACLAYVMYQSLSSSVEKEEAGSDEEVRYRRGRPVYSTPEPDDEAGPRAARTMLDATARVASANLMTVAITQSRGGLL